VAERHRDRAPRADHHFAIVGVEQAPDQRAGAVQLAESLRVLKRYEGGSSRGTPRPYGKSLRVFCVTDGCELFRGPCVGAFGVVRGDRGGNTLGELCNLANLGAITDDAGREERRDLSREDGLTVAGRRRDRDVACVAPNEPVE
jgi:hypothetical protein